MRADDVQRQYLHTAEGSSARPPTSTGAPVFEAGGSSSRRRPTRGQGRGPSSSRGRRGGGQGDGESPPSEEDPNDPPFELGASQLHDAPTPTQVSLSM